MPRDSNGSYTLPAGNPVIVDTVIETEWANPTMTDVATELSRSLDRMGRGAMQAPLLIADGARSAPGIAFSLAPGTGMYRDAITGAWRFALEGQDVMEFYLDISDPEAPTPSINLIAAVSLGATTTTFDDGSVLQPGIRFTDEQQSGLYRAGTNDVSLGVGQTDMVRARKSDGVRFPYAGEGSQVSMQRGDAGRIGRLNVDAAGALHVYNGARSNATGTFGVAEQVQVTEMQLGTSALLVNVFDSQVVGNSLASPVVALRADAVGVYSVGGLLATKTYVDSVVGAISYVPLAGGTMTGPLVLSADPATALGASTKQYVDARDATRLPLTGGVLTGPLTINYASPQLHLYHTGAPANNGHLQFFPNSDGIIYLQPLNDAGAAQQSFMWGRQGNYTIPGAYARIGGSSGSWGSIDVSGSKGGYAGIRFTDVGMNLVMQSYAGYQGFLNDAGNWPLQINNGNATFPGNVTAFSDERLKTDMRPIEPITLPERLRALRYERTDQDMTQVGVSAQALREVLPECVQENDKGTLSVDYGRAALVLLLQFLEGRLTCQPQPE